jgi:hypothetical protein
MSVLSEDVVYSGGYDWLGVLLSFDNSSIQKTKKLTKALHLNGLLAHTNYRFCQEFNSAEIFIRAHNEKMK